MNKHICISWEDISSYDVIPVEVLKYTGLSKIHKEIRVICFGETNEKPFYSLDSRKCVFFELNENNIKLINSNCKIDNSVISEIMKRYADYK